MKKHSDSDYKAEDEGKFIINQGSASDTHTKKRVPKKNFILNPNVKMNKKEIMEYLSNNFIPEGQEMAHEDKLTKQQYK